MTIQKPLMFLGLLMFFFNSTLSCPGHPLLTAFVENQSRSRSIIINATFAINI